MLAERVGIRHVERNDLPQLLQGEGPTQYLSWAEFTQEIKSSSSLVAGWRIAENDYHTILPNILVGPERKLVDCVAWTSSFLKGLGNLGGLIRILTSSELIDVVSGPRHAGRLQLQNFSGTVALIFGEITARLGDQASEASFTPEQASNTLTYCLFRSAILWPAVAPYEVARRWSAVSSSAAGDRRQMRITDLVTETFDDVGRRFLLDGQHWMEPDLFDRGVQTPDRHHVLDRLFPQRFWDEVYHASAEGALRIVDNSIPRIVDMDEVSPFERAEVIARLLAQVNSSFVNQLELSKSALQSLPEIGIWLGRLFGSHEPGKVLSTNYGAGWRISSQLMAPFDPFSFPLGELSWLEFQVSRASKNADNRNLRPSAVEIFPGIPVSTAAYQGQQSQRRSAPAVSGKRSAERSVAKNGELLDAVQRSLDDAMAAINAIRRR